MSVSEPLYSYVLFVDEAGDDHLERVMPIDDTGGSDWLILSGVLVRAENEAHTADWLADLRKGINSTQGSSLHFRKLSPSKQVAAAGHIANLPLRVFALCSHKSNMRRYRNEKAAAASENKDYFYNFCCRMLLERVTEFCAEKNKTVGGNGRLKVVFSTKGGLSYGRMKAYWTKLYRQSVGKTEHLQKRRIDFDVFAPTLCEDKPHYLEPGLQLADIAASAVFQSISQNAKHYPSEAGTALLPRAARMNGRIADCGITIMPWNISKATLQEPQSNFFEAAGYRLD